MSIPRTKMNTQSMMYGRMLASRYFHAPGGQKYYSGCSFTKYQRKFPHNYMYITTQDTSTLLEGRGNSSVHTTTIQQTVIPIHIDISKYLYIKLPN